MTLADAQSQLAAWEAASLAVAKGQRYQIGDRSLQRVDASEIRSMIEFWQRRVNGLQAAAAGRSGTAGIVLADFSDDC